MLQTFYIHELVAAVWDTRGLLLGLYIAAFLIFNVITGYPWIRKQRKRRHTYKHLKSLRARRDSKAGLNNER